MQEDFAQQQTASNFISSGQKRENAKRAQGAKRAEVVTHTHTSMCVYAHIRTHIRTHTHTHTHASTRTRMFTHIHMCTHTPRCEASK